MTSVVMRPFSTSKASSALVRSAARSEEHTSELQSQSNLVCRLLLETKKARTKQGITKSRAGALAGNPTTFPRDCHGTAARKLHRPSRLCQPIRQPHSAQQHLRDVRP